MQTSDETERTPYCVTHNGENQHWWVDEAGAADNLRYYQYQGEWKGPGCYPLPDGDSLSIEHTDAM